METAQQWQQFVAEVDICRDCVVRLEGAAAEDEEESVAEVPRAAEESPGDLIELQVRALSKSFCSADEKSFR